MPSLNYLLSGSPEQLAADQIGDTILSVSAALPGAVGFTRMPGGLWEGPPVIREVSPDGDIKTYDPNEIDGNFAKFARYDHTTGLYLAASLPQTQAAARVGLAGLAIMQYGRGENVTEVGLSDIETTQSFGRKVMVAMHMQSLVRSVLEWYGVQL